jgi:hypothetical protein
VVVLLSSSTDVNSPGAVIISEPAAGKGGGVWGTGTRGVAGKFRGGKNKVELGAVPAAGASPAPREIEFIVPGAPPRAFKLPLTPAAGKGSHNGGGGKAPAIGGGGKAPAIGGGGKVPAIGGGGKVPAIGGGGKVPAIGGGGKVPAIGGGGKVPAIGGGGNKGGRNGVALQGKGGGKNGNCGGGFGVGVRAGGAEKLAAAPGLCWVSFTATSAPLPGSGSAVGSGSAAGSGSWSLRFLWPTSFPPPLAGLRKLWRE